jgi:uncharacterized membrane protein YsdA (DUF1294 family)/cold shock CspA family protein
MRFEGTLKVWNDARGFGFIQADHGGQEIFVHIKAWPGRPQPGQRVSFELTRRDDKKRASNVQLLRAGGSRAPLRAQRPDAPAQWGTAGYLALPAFALLYLMVAVLWRVPHSVAGLYAGASLICFISYAADKQAARAGRHRISENTLLLLGLACGWPGALLAQQLLRHKSNKRGFLRPFWATVIINSAAFVYLCSPACP